ncbi:response regulator [bacterium]|nr:response regulator [bacterium]MBU1653023.1 response regulator [bacterium]
MFQTIIIADDSATARMFVKRCLEIAGYDSTTLLEACDGREALELAGTRQADLLITDLNMPVMDGKSLLKRVKSSPKLVGLEVLVISSLSSPAKEAELKELGALAVLSKPITPAKLMDVLPQTIKPEKTTWG